MVGKPGPRGRHEALENFIPKSCGRAQHSGGLLGALLYILHPRQKRVGKLGSAVQWEDGDSERCVMDVVHAVPTPKSLRDMWPQRSWQRVGSGRTAGGLPRVG